MPHPSFLTISTINCQQTDDFTGGDDLVGILGSDRFALGRFDAGTTSNAGINRAIAPGVDMLVITEDDFTGDDELIRVDLRQDMDQDRIVRIVRIEGDRARYDVSLRVQSEPDG